MIGYSHSSPKLTAEMETVLARAPVPNAYEKFFKRWKSKEEARRWLVVLGTHHPDGKLTAAYGGKNPKTVPTSSLTDGQAHVLDATRIGHERGESATPWHSSPSLRSCLKHGWVRHVYRDVTFRIRNHCVDRSKWKFANAVDFYALTPKGWDAIVHHLYAKEQQQQKDAGY